MIIDKFEDSMLYFRMDCPINDKIILKQPTIGDIIAFGESNYYSMINSLVMIPSDVKYPLFKSGIDYETISNFELFTMLTKDITAQETRLILGDLDLSKLIKIQRTDNDEIALVNPDTGVVIDRYIYQIIFDYICKLHGITPKVERAGNAYTKKILIEEDREKRERAKSKPEKQGSILLPSISYLTNVRGCKAKDILDLGIYEFYDSIKRTEHIKKVELTIAGLYSGNLDSSKINKSELDWKKPL